MFLLRPGERFVSPGIPLYRIVGMLKEVGALFVDQVICVFFLGLHDLPLFFFVDLLLSDHGSACQQDHGEGDGQPFYSCHHLHFPCRRIPCTVIVNQRRGISSNRKISG